MMNEEEDPLYTLTSKVQPPRRTQNHSKDVNVSRRMTFCSKDPYMARRIQIFERSGSKDTRYFGILRKVSFDLNNLSKDLVNSKDQLVKTFVDQNIFRLRQLTFIDFLDHLIFRGPLLPRRIRFSTNTLDFWEFPI
ncbi:hypothetical protein HanPI659440_Chr04g0173801 [Helianthus annuus]|nr:hypothetical protein HanPI659440_Chr04g0173801 [Helianthus annuus]